MASYPTAVASFTTKLDGAGNTIQAAHVNDLQAEVVAIEAGLLTGTAPLSSSNSTHNNLSVLGGSTMAGGLVVGGALSVTGGSTFLGQLNASTVAVASGLILSGVNSALLAAGNNDDYLLHLSTPGLCHVRLTANAAGSTLTGFHMGAAAETGRMFLLTNVSAPDIVLKSQTGSANQIATPGSANITLNALDSCWVIRDNVFSLWFVVGY